MNKHTIEARIHASIKPQLDRADALLDHYTDGLPREVWQPIADKVAMDHYGTTPFPAVIGSFAHHMQTLGTALEQITAKITDTLRKIRFSL